MLVEIVAFLKTMALPTVRAAAALLTSSSCGVPDHPFVHTHLTCTRAPHDLPATAS